MHLHRHLLCVVVPAVLLPLTGCYDSKNPLSDPQTSKPDERLVGVWQLADEDGGLTYYHVGHAGEKFPDGVMRVAFVRHKKGKVAAPGELFVFPTVLGNKRYLNVAIEKEQRERPSDVRGWGAVAVESYFLLKYQVDGDKLLLWSMDGDAKKQAISSGKIKGVIEKVIEKDMFAQFTDTTENVARFVAQFGDSLFSKEPLRLERVDAGKKR